MSFFFLPGCYLVRPVKSNCFSRLRTRTETTTIKRVGGIIPVEKESKLSTGRGGMAKNGNHSQRVDDAIECQL